MRLIILNPYSLPIVNPRSLRINNIIKSTFGKIDTIQLCNPVEGYKNSSKHIKQHGFKLPNSKSNQLNNKSLFLEFIQWLIWPDIFVLNSIIHFLFYFFKYKCKNDILLTLSNPVSEHLVGLLIKLFKIKGVYWIADIGDIFSHVHARKKSSRLKKLTSIYEKWVLTYSDCIVVNSESIRDFYLEEYNVDSAKVKLIYNGPNVEFDKINSEFGDEIILSYFGNCYLPIRPAVMEIEILLEVITLLELRGFKSKLKLIGRQYSELFLHYGSNKKIEFCQQLSPYSLINEFQIANVLICFANKNYPGMQSKLEDYVNSGLPIVYFCYNASDSGQKFLEGHHLVLNYQLGLDNPNKLYEFVEKNKFQGIDQQSRNVEINKLNWPKLLEDLNILNK
ncbi:MAG: glycosyltransferase [Saprospiraceae bacterium]